MGDHMFKNVGARIAFLFLCLIGICMPADAQRNPTVAWPTVTRDMKPWTRWWWLGSAVDKPGLSSQIAELDAAGFGGVEVTVIYGAKGADSAYIPYLTPKWVEMIAHTAAETHRRGMGLDLPQGSGWRIGGPSVEPADVNLSLRVAIDSVAGGETWQTDFSNRHVSAVLAVSNSGQRMIISAIPPIVRWTAPQGKWTIYVAETRFSGDNVKRPSPGGQGPAIDPFSVTATTHYLDMFRQRTAALPRGAIRSYFHDSFEYTGDATSNLFDEFKRRRGYDLAMELPALANRGEGDHIARVKSDYRQTLDELLRENFVEHLTSWSHQQGSLMREQAHGSPGNLLDLYAASDIPETEIFGVLRGPDGDPLINKFASSAAHVGGHRLASSESFTWLGEHFTGTLDEIKQAADRMFLAGINHLIYHGTSYSPANVPWPGWEFYASTELNPRNAFWHDLPAFNTYVARVQSFLQAGTPDEDILLYWPVADSWHDSLGKRMDFRVHDPAWFHNKPFGKLARTLYESGYAVDYVSDRQLSEHISVTGHALKAHDASYRVVVVPETSHMPPETFARLLALARSGATVVFAGALPSDVPGLARLEERRAQLARAVASVSWSPTVGGVRTGVVGKGRVLSGDAIEPLLAAAGVARDPLSTVDHLQLIRRRGVDETVYFVVAGQPVRRWVPTGQKVTALALMDPVSGRAGLAKIRKGAHGSEVYLELEAGQSMIVRAFNRSVGGSQWAYEGDAGAPVALGGEWNVSFADGGPVLPPSYSASTFGAWTGRGNADADRFAGTATYSITFDAPDAARRHVLSLGRVGESARVRLNGRALGVLFASPFRVETGPLKRTGNVLEVDVTNVSANRIRDLDQRSVPWKVFNDINFVSIDYKAFDASKWPVRPAGLIGPVELHPLASSACCLP